MAPPPAHGYAARWRLWATCVGDHHKDRRPRVQPVPRGWRGSRSASQETLGSPIPALTSALLSGASVRG